MHTKRIDSSRRRGLLLPAALCCVAICRAFAQDVVVDAPTTLEQTVTPETIEQARAALNAQEGLEEAAKNQILALYDEAQKQLTLGEDSKAKAAEYDRLREEAPTLATELQAQLAEPPATDLKLPAETTPLVQLEVELSSAEAEYREKQDTFEQLLREPSQRRQRRREIPAQQADVRKRIQEARTTAAENTTQNGERPEATSARRMVAQARVYALTQELSALERELLFYDARSSVITLRQEVGQRKLSYAEKRFKALQDRTQASRKEEAQAAAAEARQALQETVGQDERIRDMALDLAETNAELAAMRTGDEGLTERIEQASKNLQAENARLERLNQAYQEVIDRVASGGLNPAVGVLMRQQKSDLPDQRRLIRDIDERQDLISTVEQEQGEFRSIRIQLRETEENFQVRLEELSADLTDLEKYKLRSVITSLIQSQRDTLDALELDYDRYLTELLALSSAQQNLLEQAELFEDYINENILWIGGEPPISVETPQDTLRALTWLGDPSASLAVPASIFRFRHTNVVLHFGLSLVILCLFFFRHRALRDLKKHAKSAKDRRNTDHAPTVQALVLSLFSAIWLPAFLYWFGWTLGSGAGNVDQSVATGSGLMAAAPLLFLPELARILLRPNGLLAAHFGWPAKHVASARRSISVMLIAAIPLATLYLLFENQDNPSYKESAGRLALIALLLVTAATTYRLSGLAKRGMLELRRHNWYTDRERTRIVVRVLITALPVSLAIVASTGYLYSAQQLSERLYITLALLMSIAVVIGMIRRWLLLTRRRIAIEQARRRREALRAEAEKKAAAAKKAREEGTEIHPAASTLTEATVQVDAELSDEELDIVRVDTQTQSLVRSGAFLALVVGMWFIWADFVPALNILNDFTAWRVEDTIQNEITLDDGSVRVESIPTVRNITYAHLGMAIFMIAITVAAVRNLPGLLEIILLQRLKMGAGERYATLSIVRYALTAIGGVMAFNSIGIGWERVQWLVAALSVGLGFGLQEIFANFVSGLILLFERPVRVGDTVTIGNLSGTVTQIRIRATTITDWDRKELIVPNREFVTGQLINWSLSDTVLRVTIPVGIAYGSDTKKAMDVMYKAVGSAANALKDPPPQVCFLGFGDSSLDFEIRVFCQSVEHFIPLKHELHLAIDSGFREANIEIPFPQRDVHFRTKMDVVQHGESRPVDAPEA